MIFILDFSKDFSRKHNVIKSRSIFYWMLRIDYIVTILYLFFRHSIAQVKEIFCFTPRSEDDIKSRNSENSNFPQNAYLLQKKDSSSTFLFERGHLFVGQQFSNESTSTKRSEDTISIAKTNLWSIFIRCRH